MYPDQSNFLHLPEFLNNREQGIVIGNDVAFHLSEGEGKPQMQGFITVSANYFLEPLDGNEQLQAEYFQHLARPFFSVRSKLMQAGLLPVFGNFSENENGTLTLPTTVLSTTGKPFIHIPEEFPIGRFFLPNYQRRLTGEVLAQAANSISEEATLAQGVKGLIMDQESPSGDMVAFQVPVEKFFTSTQWEIDITEILATRNRQELDEALRLEEIAKTKLEGVEKLSYLGETGIIRVPENMILVLNPGYSDEQGFHYPSTIIDSGFTGPVRIEVFSGQNQLYNMVEFMVLPTNVC